MKIGKRKDYFSPSQINSFIDRRDGYIRSYVLGMGWRGNASFARGTAIEHGLDLAINGMADTQAADEAWKKYQEEVASLHEDERSKFNYQHIEAMTLTAIRYYMNDLGASPAVESQVKLKVKIDGLSTPLMGFADFIFPTSPFGYDAGIRDLKTAAKSPSKNSKTGNYTLSSGYARQGTVYHLATNRPVTFDYIIATKTPKAISVALTDETIARTIPVIRAAGRALEAFWDTVPDPDDFTAEHAKAFRALAFPALDGIWNPMEKEELINEFIKLTDNF